MSDERDDTLELSKNSSGNGNGGAFNEAAAPPEPPRRNDLNGTAQAQIDLRYDHEAATHEHEQRFIALKSNFAAGNINIPTFDLGPNAGRNLKRDYDLMMTDWTDQKVQMDFRYEAQREALRDNGVTPTGEFEKVRRRDTETANDELSRATAQRDDLLSLKVKVDEFEHDVDIAQTHATKDEQLVSSYEDRFSDLNEKYADITNGYEPPELNLEASDVSMIDEWDFEADYDSIPADVEIELSSNAHYQNEYGNDDLYDMSDEYLDGLDFSATDEFNASSGYSHEGESMASDHGKSGGRGR